MAARHPVICATSSMGQTPSAVPMYGSSRRFFALHFGVFAASSFLTFFLSQAFGWGLSAALFSLSLPNAIVLLVMVAIGWVPHAIFVGTNTRLRGLNPLVTGSVGAMVLVATPHAAELFVQNSSSGASTSGIGGFILIPIYGLYVALSLFSVLAIGLRAQSSRRVTRTLDVSRG